MTSIQPELWVDQGRAALAFYERAFDAKVLHRVGEGDDIVAQLAVGDAVFWVAATGSSSERLVPRAIGGATGRVLLVVDDPDSMFAQAVAAGAEPTSPVDEEHGWRVGRLIDPFGHEWEVGKPLAAAPATVAQPGGTAEEATGWGGALWAAADLLTPMAIRVAATLRLADHIAAGTRTTEALAAALNVDQDALGRLLGHLVTAGVLARAGIDTYGLTALGAQLGEDDPAGVRPWIDLDGAVGRADLCFVQLLHTVRTGEPAFPRQFGRSFWDDLSADSDRAASFDALMGARLTADAPAVAVAYPWGTLGHVVDVGGGNGTLLIAILRAHGDLRGTVVDLPDAVARAEQAIVSAGLGHRARAQASSFFDALPVGAGGYLLSGILHDWDDEDAVRILQRCADAAAGTGEVLVVDHIGDAEGSSPNTEGDLRMLCYVRGRERSPEQLGELAKSAGLRISSVTPAGSRSIIELRPSQ
jgi:uncharacterized glyoxalase superfamily protein PhnB